MRRAPACWAGAAVLLGGLTGEIPTSDAAPPAAVGDVPLAADAGTYFSFLVPAEGPVASRERYQVREQFRADPFDPQRAAAFGFDRQRPVIHSSTIVDPALLKQQLASADMPRSTFAIRSLLVVPVLDVARAEAALDQVVDTAACARPKSPGPRWTEWLARLRDPEDRRAAETSNAVYLCSGDFWAAVVRSSPARRELRWVLASGDGALLAAAAAPLLLATDLSARLQREGFFAANTALYKTPAGDARAITALELNKTRAGVAGVDGSLKRKLWQRGTHEVSAPLRLVGSPPVLVSDFLVTDKVMTWMLTAEGRRFFSSLAIRPGTSLTAFKQAIAKKLKPGGVFASAPRALVQTIHEGGTLTPMLIRHALWPHAIAFLGAHPDADPEGLLGTEFDDESFQHLELDVDLAAGRVRLNTPAAR